MVTLHVGPGTFQPVRVEKIAEHRMLPERFEIAPDAAEAINRARSEGRRIIAVGTTSVRTLETAAREERSPRARKLRLFIYPGFVFRIVDSDYHELSFAEVDAFDACFRICRKGTGPGSISVGGGAPIPFLQLRRRDVHSSWKRQRIHVCLTIERHAYEQ
jgi:hypothetical protein